MKKNILAILSGLFLAASAYAGTGINSVQTSATGTTWVDLPAVGTIKRLHFMNDTGTSISIRIGGSGTSLTLPNQVFWSFNNINGSATGFSIRRADTGNTQVTLTFVYED